MDAIDLGTKAIQLVNIPSGTFLMGSPNVLFSEAPVHEVTIGYGFYLEKHLVTQHQWEVVMGQNNPAQLRASPEHPVDSVGREEAMRSVKGSPTDARLGFDCLRNPNGSMLVARVRSVNSFLLQRDHSSMRRACR